MAVAETATKRSSTAQRKRSQPAKRAASKPGKTAGRGVREAARAVTPGTSKGPGSLVKFAARKTLKLVARKAVQTGAQALRSAADRTVAVSRSALEASLSRRLPIQVSIDVAVPLQVTWDEWMSADSITEGVHRIDGVERDGGSLFGTISGPRSTDWEAEIVDEREAESFAWRSIEGSDCAGLVTFHRLSDRLTRIELDLDVLPVRPSEALTLSLHVAHRRAEAHLRRFKAQVEFISPDVYEPVDASDHETDN